MNFDQIVTLIVLVLILIVVPLIVRASRRIHMRHASRVCVYGHIMSSIYKMIPVGSRRGLFLCYHSFIIRKCKCGLECENDEDKDFLCLNIWWRMIFDCEQFDVSDEDIFVRAGLLVPELVNGVEPLLDRIARSKELKRIQNVEHAHANQIERFKFIRSVPDQTGVFIRSQN